MASEKRGKKRRGGWLKGKGKGGEGGEGEPTLLHLDS